ncbi:MAG: ASKHA domain-containing protein [Phycisphaerales bacterium]
MNELKITFQPQGRTVYVLPGTKIIEAAAIAGVIIDTPCGGMGKCGKCKVVILESGNRIECLACQQTLTKDTVVEVPKNSLLLAPDKIVVDSEIVQKIIPDRKVKDGSFGVAVDIGTTTIAASLVNLKDGNEIAVLGSHNPQITYGDDVISRIKVASGNPKGLEHLQKAVIKQINSMINDLCKQGGIAKEDIYEITIAGNTAMQHLLRGIDPTPLATLPFEPSWFGNENIKASQLGININSEGMIYIFPVIGGFVGGDISAGMIAVDLLNQPQPLLMIDIGTNGEIVLVNENKILAASAAAGPAFEGAGISCGMRAMSGAIEKVKYENNGFVYNVIGNTKPIGICGSGLIDTAAELLNAGLVDCTGRMNGNEVVIAPKVAITQKDIRQMQLAVGAIRAGITIMLKKAGISASDLQRIFVAGGFGSFIRRNHAQRIGLLPADVNHEKISFIGNTSLAGAKLALLSLDARQKTYELASQAEHVELSADFDFQNEFANAMIFP